MTLCLLKKFLEMLIPGGHAVITMDFNNKFSQGMPLPTTDVRFYTTGRVLSEFIPALDCCEMVDCYDWPKYKTDFMFEGCEYSFTTFVFRKYDSTLAPELRIVGQKYEDQLQIKIRDCEIENLNRKVIALNSVYASRFWRITAPLRWCSDQARLLRGAAAAAKGLISRILFIGFQIVRSAPSLKRVLSSAARRFPSLGGAFLAFAVAHPRPLPRTLRPARRKSAGSQAPYVPLGIQHKRTAAATKTKRVLYYYVDHTIGGSVNSGVQRVARGLARGLIEAGEDVVFVCWSSESKALVRLIVMN